MQSIIARMREVIVSPKEFFAGIAKETDVKRTSIYLLVLMIIGFILQLISVVAIQPTFNQLFASIIQNPVNTGEVNPEFIIPTFINNVIIGFLLSLIFTSVLHFWLKLFSKKPSWKATYNVYVYSRTPIYLSSWLPVLNIIGWIYGIYLLVVGVEKVHKLDRKTATLVIVVPIILLFIVSTIIMLITFSSIKN